MILFPYDSVSCKIDEIYSRIKYCVSFRRDSKYGYQGEGGRGWAAVCPLAIELYEENQDCRSFNKTTVFTSGKY